ncbi:hypothetical protein MTR_4g055090 [Medicago truncatula]|uniref:Uncharacterized protein n=1 Tax=Medicago truncatula TaxID=3880 RepID=G7JKX5_MEDTR|nr:hypothetical protein MTR_4g055090 [Medicago truncatula]
MHNNVRPKQLHDIVTFIVHNELGSQRPNEPIMVTIWLPLSFKGIQENQCQGGIAIENHMIFATTGPSHVKTCTFYSFKFPTYNFCHD